MPIPGIATTGTVRMVTNHPVNHKINLLIANAILISHLVLQKAIGLMGSIAVHPGIDHRSSGNQRKLRRQGLVVIESFAKHEGAPQKRLAPKRYPFDELIELHGDDLLDVANLDDDLEQALNFSELCRRRFRSIAQVSGLVTQSMPGQNKTGGQLQISAALLFDVFQKHEPNHLLLEQARREVLEEQLETQRLRTALERMASSEWLMERTQRPGPLAFPLLVERLNNRLSNESVLDRVQRLIAEATKAER